jgi:uncharacterized protein (UPF0335 family)
VSKAENPRAVLGGNSDVGGIASDKLKSFVDRIETLEIDKKQISDDIKDVYAEAKGTGFDPAIIRAIIAERKKNADDLKEREELMDLYRMALGMASRADTGDL